MDELELYTQGLRHYKRKEYDNCIRALIGFIKEQTLYDKYTYKANEMMNMILTYHYDGDVITLLKSITDDTGLIENYIGYTYLGSARYMCERYTTANSYGVSAVEWFIKSTKIGNHFGQYNLGFLYQSGKMTIQEIGRASCRERV